MLFVLVVWKIEVGTCRQSGLKSSELGTSAGFFFLMILGHLDSEYGMGFFSESVEGCLFFPKRNNMFDWIHYSRFYSSQLWHVRIVEETN